jgi:hypothetical protein
MFSTELQDFGARIDFVQKLMAKMEAVNREAENSLRDEIKRKEELLKERDEQLAVLKSEINALMQQVAEMKREKGRPETLPNAESRRPKKATATETEADGSVKVPVDPFEILIS